MNETQKEKDLIVPKLRAQWWNEGDAAVLLCQHPIQTQCLVWRRLRIVKFLLDSSTRMNRVANQFAPNSKPSGDWKSLVWLNG